MLRSGGFRVRRKAADQDIADGLSRLLPAGAVSVYGTDARALQRLVTVACRGGLEIRDSNGDLSRAADRLTEAYGYAYHGSRLRQRWSVEVMQPTTAVPDSERYWIEAWGTNPDGRRVVFNKNTFVDLSRGDLL